MVFTDLIVYESATSLYPIGISQTVLIHLGFADCRSVK